MRRQYYAMQQFSAYIRPGSHILQQPIEEITAAYDPRTDSTTLVVTNDDTTADVRNFDLLDRTGAFTRTIRTSDAELFKSLGSSGVSGTQFSVTAPDNTITTLVIFHKPNLVQNSNFDLGGAGNGASAIAGWQSEGDAAFDVYHDNTRDRSGSGRLLANSFGNSGKIFQTGIGDVDTDLAGNAYQLSVDVQFQNANGAFYDADTYLTLEFYGADDQTLTHAATEDFETVIIPALSIDETRSFDSDYRTFRSDRFVAPEGTHYVRPVIRFDNVDTDSTDWVFLDNVYLQVAHPEAAGREWASEGSGAGPTA